MPEIRARFDAAIDDFNEATENLRSLLAFVHLHGPAEATLRVTLLNNLLVAMVATSEEAIREVFNVYLSLLKEKHNDHRQLRANLQKANVNAFLAQLKKLNDGRSTEQASTLARDLSLCLTGDPQYVLMSADLTYNVGNFRSHEITEIAKRCGLTDFFRAVCDDPQVADWTGQDDCDSRVTFLVRDWNAIFDERDLIVHQISQANGWTKDRIEAAVSLARLLILRIGRVLEADIRG